ncbi:pilus assembly protein PilP [Vibrio hannami]|uniref:pilus assembly protein PilP n=1 Tax=Vibrio hannami TaxID=2717094 RepID=UPI00240FB3D4|nr:pilus assembly protein PilP [Vibrio hannami]MDG3084667.1 pilus assembly protein PilP [Vibrio hannami]
MPELDLNDIAEWPRKFQMLGLMLLFLIIQLLLYWLVILPKQEQRSERLKLIAQKQNILVMKSGSASQKMDLEETLRDKHRRLVNMSHSSSGGKSQVDILSVVNRFASANRLTVHQIDKKQPLGNNVYVQHLFDIQISGRFEDLGRFFGFIAYVKPYIGFERIEFLKDSADSSEISVRISAVTYSLDDNWQRMALEAISGLNQTPEPEQGLSRYNTSFNPVSPRDIFEFAALESNSGIAQQKCTKSSVPGDLTEIEKFKLGELSLKGFLRADNKKAALIQTPDGKVVSVKEGDSLGDEGGYVLSINQHDLLIYETAGGCESHKPVYWPKRSINIEVRP